MDSLFISLLQTNKKRNNATLKEYSSLIAKQYENDIETASAMWDLLISEYGKDHYFASILRIRNELAKIIGERNAYLLLAKNPDRVISWLSATKGKISSKLSELCPYLIENGDSEIFLSFMEQSSVQNDFPTIINRLFFFLHKDIILSEINPENFNKDLYLNRDQFASFCKFCINHSTNRLIKDISFIWLHAFLKEPITNNKDLEIFLHINTSLLDFFPDGCCIYTLEFLYQHRDNLNTAVFISYLEELFQSANQIRIDFTDLSAKETVYSWYASLLLQYSEKCCRLLFTKNNVDDFCKSVLNACISEERWDQFEEYLTLSISTAEKREDKYNSTEQYIDEVLRFSLQKGVKYRHHGQDTTEDYKTDLYLGNTRIILKLTVLEPNNKYITEQNADTVSSRIRSALIKSNVHQTHYSKKYRELFIE